MLSQTRLDEELVRRLIAAQFPEWARLPVREVASAGTDNAMFRLGEEFVVRLPKDEGSLGQVAKEQRWLPRLAPALPLAVPVPVGLGAPGEGYELPWSVYAWLDGRDAFDAPIADLPHAAAELGRFGVALRGVDATGGPTSFRGGPVTDWEQGAMAEALRDLAADGTLDGELATAAWESVLRLPAYDGEPVWVHGDLLPGNLLTRDGRLTAVIDFGGLGTGDPACDTMAAWTLFTPETRPLFREAARVDDATWARGRGWALCWGVVTEHYYRGKNPVLASVAHRSWSQALAEYAEILG
ncbi:aminoglycoside phosphotransferase family protein [Streptomyces roseicoloratus]|uniref:Aminoglycoside phosphotransferase family protein n=1 Tax=Streptomyces roseicoloratus TaxID=2508722 RepID=A0ABY9RW67_9ACTN|nr:aminoglycoside phosphotransferase family protein [Streptomyces roseicoloratus]WMX45751.1 aminoglycoside phosphotransferase family protein [Streptomyces roseicoloratus]